ncbi:MAG: Omp28 family outer membrane lipoprotein [Bacteroidales bacterium]|nr:Omp28 family outer membrane lipoprotein [Bacteroidales bacterium]
MNKIVKIFISIALGVFIFQSCDKIEEPYEREINGGGGNRKVLLEDYTGHTCVNCPGAAMTAHELKDEYKDQLVIIAVHAGYFAQPTNAPFTADFRTDVGEELNDFFGIVSNPSGMVNRIGEGQDRILVETEWQSAVGQEVARPADAGITISNIYNEQTRVLNTSLDIEFINALPGAYRVCAYIIEDSIVAPQKNNDPALGPTPDWLDYVHDNMLRGSLNGTWGDIVTDENIAAGSIYTVQYDGFTLNAEWKDRHCAIVAFVYNEDTFEIIQAEEEKVK